MSGLVEPVDGDDAEFTRLARLGRLRVTYACECCRRRFPMLERDGCCPACHRRLIAAGGVPGTVRILPKGAPAPVSVRGMSEYCGNGHKWRPETTRWRYRDRGGRHGRGWERDCLLCKQKSDGFARMGRNVKGRNVTITITKTGTHWNSGTPGGKEQ